MSVKIRQLQRAKDLGRPAKLYFSNNVVAKGYVIDLDSTDLVFRDGQTERTYKIAEIISVEIESPTASDNPVLAQLLEAHQKQALVVLHLRSGETTSAGKISDLDDESLLLESSGSERTIRVADVVRLAAHETNAPSDPPPPPPTHYARIRQMAAVAEQGILQVQWAITKLPEIITISPVALRTAPVEGNIWARAVNFARDRSWHRAADEFVNFAQTRLAEKLHEPYLNAALAKYFAAEYTTSAIYFEQSIHRDANQNNLLGGIAAAQAAGFWHKAVDWMARYMQMTQGTDPRVFAAIDFYLRFGLNKTARQVLQTALEGTYPPDGSWATSRLCAIVARQPAISPIVLNELEQLIAVGNMSVANLIRVVGSIAPVITDDPTLEYRQAEQIERTWLEKNPKFDLQRITSLRERANLARQQARFKEAEELYSQLLTLLPNDTAAQSALRDVRSRLAPPLNEQPRPYTPPPQPKVTKGSLYDRARKANDQGRLEEAKKLYLQCVETKGERWTSAVMDLAGLYLRLGGTDVKSGIDHIIRNYSHLESNAADNMLGALYSKVGEYGKAIESYQKVLNRARSQSDQVAPMISIAILHIKQSRLDRAKALLMEVLRIRPNQTAAKGLLDRLQTGNLVQGNSASLPLDYDKQGNITPSGHVVGGRTIGIGPFLEAELEIHQIKELDRVRIEKGDFSQQDVKYLLGFGGRIGAARKPETVAPYFLSAAKVLAMLDERADDQFSESLRRYCAARADYFNIKNRDVARTYYLESFRLEDVITTQLGTKFIQFLMTLVSDRDEFLRPEIPYTPPQILVKTLSHADQKIRLYAVLGILNVSLVNSDILRKLDGYFREAAQAKHYFTGALHEFLGLAAPKAGAEIDLSRLIETGQKRIREAQDALESRFRYFMEISESSQLLFDNHAQFINWSPDFIGTATDFDGTDANRISYLKGIIGRYAKFYSETIFEEKDSLRAYILSEIDTLVRDIDDWPTYYGRCFIRPLALKWRNCVETYFEQVASVSQPDLQLTEVVKAAYGQNGAVEMHLVLSNQTGKSAASGIKLLILPSPSEEYRAFEQEVNIGLTLSSGKETTVTAYVECLTDQPAFTLNYQLVYSNRQGKEILTSLGTVPVRLSREQFQEIYNPYTTWANSNQVTDPNMFFGRDALIDELLALFSVPHQRKMMVIYGQKRAGKSSILYHVTRRLDEQLQSRPAIPVIAFGFSMGDIIMDFSVQTFFHKLAQEMYRKFRRVIFDSADSPIAAPQRNDFQEDPFGQFVDFSEKLLGLAREKQGFEQFNPLVWIDEFTYIYKAILEGHLNANFMKAWKALSEKRMFNFLLSGVDEMPEFIQQFPNDFAVAQLKRVSYLDDDSARDLIQKPIWDHEADRSRFQERALARLKELTGNSAFYIQIFNNRLVDYLNEQHTGYVTEADINAVARQLTFGEHALNFNQSFDNLTRYKHGQNQSREEQIEGKVVRVLARLTRTETYGSEESILRQFEQADHDLVKRILQLLVNREVIQKRENAQQYAFVVGLFKEWLNRSLPYEEALR